MKKTAWISIALLGIVGSFVSPATTAQDDLPLTIQIHARAVAPGEPLRVEVLSPEALESVEGKFLGQSVFMVRQGSSDEGERWTGWTMVALDEEAGITLLELHGTSAGGRPVVGSHAVTIEAKEFPEEHLSVPSKYVSPPPEVEARLAQERKKLRAIYESRRQFVPGEEPFVRPVPGDPTSTFGTRRLYNGKPRSPHPGLDLRAATGTPVRSSGGGLVVLSQDLYYSGNTVIVDHGGGLFTIYAHLSELHAAEGQEIAAGDVVGLSGATGRVTGPHLHWGAKIGNRPFDPQALLDPALF
jgi:murein DD-endopeptidase MepM/ murein hydrolase activator NlpD